MFKRRKPDEPITGEPAVLSVDPPPFKPGSEAVAARTEAIFSNGPDDFGLGVPPFRPAPTQETSVMVRAPFSPSSANTPSPAPSLAPSPVSQNAQRSGAIPLHASHRDPAERRTLVVGRGISVQGTVQDAERLVVEGTVEATMIHATELAISQGGMFKGEVEVEDAEIGGTINGTLTVRGSLVVRATGRVLGTARYRRLQVEDGGQVSGQMEVLTETARTELSRAVPEHAA